MPTQSTGMMGQMAQAPTPNQPSDAPQPVQSNDSGGYTGTVTFDGKSFQVKGGVIEDEDGETFYVSDDGMMVVDGERNIVGYVKEGEILPIDDDHVEVLREMGVLE